MWISKKENRRTKCAAGSRLVQFGSGVASHVAVNKPRSPTASPVELKRKGAQPEVADENESADTGGYVVLLLKIGANTEPVVLRVKLGQEIHLEAIDVAAKSARVGESAVKRRKPHLALRYILMDFAETHHEDGLVVPSKLSRQRTINVSAKILPPLLEEVFHEC